MKETRYEWKVLPTVEVESLFDDIIKVLTEDNTVEQKKETIKFLKMVEKLK